MDNLLIRAHDTGTSLRVSNQTVERAIMAGVARRSAGGVPPSKITRQIMNQILLRYCLWKYCKNSVPFCYHLSLFSTFLFFLLWIRGKLQRFVLVSHIFSSPITSPAHIKFKPENSCFKVEMFELEIPNLNQEISVKNVKISQITSDN